MPSEVVPVSSGFVPLLSGDLEWTPLIVRWIQPQSVTSVLRGEIDIFCGTDIFGVVVRKNT